MQGIENDELIFSSTEIEILDDAYCEESLVRILSRLRSDTRIIKVVLAGNHLTPQLELLLGEIVQMNTTIEFLSLGDNHLINVLPITQGLELNSSIANLNLSYNSIGDIGCIPLFQSLLLNSTLKLLAIFGVGMTDNAAPHLARLIEETTCLEKLHIGGNFLTDIGVSVIASALINNRTITRVGIVRSQFGEIGGQALIRLLERNTTIDELIVTENNISPRTASRIESLTNSLELRKNWNRALAFCSLAVERLGLNSPLRGLPRDLLPKVIQMLYSGEALYYVPEQQVNGEQEEEEEEVEQSEDDFEHVGNENGDDGVDSEED